MKILLEEKILEKKAKSKVKYYWILETVIGKKDASDDYFEGFEQSSSEKDYLQEIKDEIIEKINSESIFNFDFEPKEGDYLSIKSNVKKNEYLNLIYLNNHWIEEVFSCTLRECDTDIYTTIKTGVAFLYL